MHGDIKKTSNKKKFFNTKKILLLFFFFSGMCAFLFSPVFSVKNIEVTEIEKYSKNEICQMIEAEEGINMFLFNRFKAVKTLESSPYIEDAKISYKFLSVIHLIR